MISLDNVTVAYGGYVLLDGISFHISERDKIGLVGKNGAGKSTIMKLICELQSPTSGHIDKPRRIIWEVKYMKIFDDIYAILKEFINSYIAMIKKLVEGFQKLGKDEDTTAAA